MTGKLPRRQSRSLAFQVLYGQEFVACESLDDLRRAFRNAPRPQNASEQEADQASGFAWELAAGVWSRLSSLDGVIAAHARNWRLERVGKVELTLLRLAVYEMLFRPDVPPKVAMNEALELNRQFGEEKSRSFVNGILDAVSRALESGELKAEQPYARQERRDGNQ